ncbi:aquaporin [Pseudovirgaria hyperparasitica]|uniref:Aquaporin n=1 Tax=Pseudovirgaria hyperparasitica TaxID=470096 RepID=A0A6A6W7W0_9PEZI|nr:aquaporin [Pseudovirgaria hyperparasitica]KAF2757667.1 aquaporin [Pseudovirgaria hyperparasitica]
MAAPGAVDGDELGDQQYYRHFSRRSSTQEEYTQKDYEPELSQSSPRGPQHDQRYHYNRTQSAPFTYFHDSRTTIPLPSPSHTQHLETISTQQPSTFDLVTRKESRASSLPTLQKTRQRLGLHPTVPIIDEHDEEPHNHLIWSKIKLTLREPFAEFWGTFILILFGNGAVAQVLLSVGDTTAPGGNGYGSYQSISWGWGIGIMLGIYVAGDSGAYLNPAVTFCSCLYRKLPWRRFPLYLLAQLLGGFVASGVVYANYINAINDFEGHNVRTVPPSSTATAGIFCTYPKAYLTRASQFFSEFIASAVLMFVIFALKDNGNMGGSKGDKWFPLALFFLIFGIGACFGVETGYAINLARDFGPRLMSYAVGYGSEVWSAGGYYFWVPIVAPFCGCTFGGFLYDAFIYTGESPVNTPWLGLRRIFSPRAAAKARRQRERRAKEEGVV